MEPNLVLASTILLLAFTVLANVDGLYLHLWRYRLYARPESRKEHWLHTFRSLLFPGILATLFLVPPYGVVLWLGLALLAVDQVVEILDVSSERASRGGLGGLSSFEYSLHLVITTLRVGALTLALAAVPPEAWSLWASASPAQEPPLLIRLTVALLLLGNILVAGLHVWLGCWYALPNRSRLPGRGQPA